jgi:hypothetical protein
MAPYALLSFGFGMFVIGVLRINTAHDYVNMTPHAGHGGLVPLGIVICVIAVIWSMF